MRAVVCGYHLMGCLGLEALLHHGYEVTHVVTHRDDPREEIWWPSVAELAGAHGIPVRYAEETPPAALDELARAAEPDFLFSFYFRNMIPAATLELARLGALNLHGSLLPRYRGRAPVNWVLVNGEAETGVSLHYMVAKPDAGDLVDQERVAIAPLDTAYTLYLRLAEAARALLDRALPALADGSAARVPLDLATGSYYGGRKPADGAIEWTWSARRVCDLVRAVTHPYPGAFTHFAGREVRVWWALPVATGSSAREPGTVLEVDSDGVVVAAGEGAVRLVLIQPQGQPEGPAASLAGILGMRPGASFDSTVKGST